MMKWDAKGNPTESIEIEQTSNLATRDGVLGSYKECTSAGTTQRKRPATTLNTVQNIDSSM